MRLDGALEPHHGAPFDGSSLGVEKNCEKQCESQCDAEVSKFTSPSNNSYNNNNGNKRWIVAQTQKQQQSEQQQQQQQQEQPTNELQPKTEVNISINETIKVAAIKISKNNKEDVNEHNLKKINDSLANNITTNGTKTVKYCYENFKTQYRNAMTKMDAGKLDIADSTICDNASENCLKYWLGFFMTGSIGVATILYMRVQQTLMAANSTNNSSKATIGRTLTRSFAAAGAFVRLSSLVLCLISVVTLLPYSVRCDDGDNFFAVNSFSMGPETTTPEFDYASRGQKKFGDKCDNTLECGFPGSICDPKKKYCQCTEDLPVTNHIDKCGKEASVNESCFFNEQCEARYFQTECRDGRCSCRFEMTPVWAKDGTVECSGRQDKRGSDRYLDPAMIGVLVGMALMFVIICVVLRLFSQARWHDNRTIFNTPNPRLMNVSLLRESKLLHGQERRGSRMSVRAPSRQPSMASLRPHSPNPSLGRMTRSKSNTRSSDSRVSDVSNCSRLLEHPSAHTTHHHIGSLPPISSSTTLTTTSAACNETMMTIPTTTANITSTTYITSPGAGTACGMSLSAPPIASTSSFNTTTNKF